MMVWRWSKKRRTGIRIGLVLQPLQQAVDVCKKQARLKCPPPRYGRSVLVRALLSPR